MSKPGRVKRPGEKNIVPHPERLRGMLPVVSRRSLILGGSGLLAGGLIAANWRRLSTESGYWPLLQAAEVGSLNVQRLVLHNRPLAPEYRRDQLSANHPSNGGFGALYVEPDPAYDRMVATGFRDWRLYVSGLVDRPMRVSLDELHAMPTRTQVTMHSCDAGWSSIAEWTGVPLRFILERVGLQRSAKYVVFRCLDKVLGEHVFGSIDLLDAFHPQTILAHAFNGQTLPPKYGAPLRLRMELQIGYKQFKHIEQISVVSSLEDVGKGRGGLYEQYGYQWYAGL
jgi:DMSO/TMAO reductase YedYZ molybdopterin-dependent catalytic subunit